MLGYLVPVSIKQDDFSHMIVHFSVFCIGHFKTSCTVGLFQFTGYIVPTRGCSNCETMFSDLKAAMFGPHIQGSGGRESESERAYK